MKKLGFGAMRLPLLGEEPKSPVDLEKVQEMVDAFLSRGFTYFDTAYGYIGGKSEKAIKEALVDRYPRESYILTNKLSVNFFDSNEEIRPLFEKQLEICGVDYFDFYLFHCLNREGYAKHLRCNSFEKIKKLKERIEE